jgi:hypothetical protein
LYVPPSDRLDGFTIVSAFNTRPQKVPVHSEEKLEKRNRRNKWAVAERKGKGGKMREG